jgi:hypothetical protein
MPKTTRQKASPEALFSDWMKTAAEFWGPLASMWAGSADADAEKSPPQREEKSRAQASWEDTQKMWEAFSAAMIAPRTMETLFKGTDELPKILLKMTQTGWAGFAQLQKEWLEKSGQVDESARTRAFEYFDKNAFNIWVELYEKELRQYFNIPQLGLTRVYQEKINRALDKFHRHHVNTAEFLQLLQVPFNKSFKVMQESLAKLAEKRELPEDSKDYYKMWINTLEEHFMALLKSPEYTQVMNKALDALSEFTAAKNEVVQDMLSMLPVPTQREMDELYKEIYLLKKRIRRLEKNSDK